MSNFLEMAVRDEGQRPRRFAFRSWILQLLSFYGHPWPAERPVYLQYSFPARPQSYFIARKPVPRDTAAASERRGRPRILTPNYHGTCRIQAADFSKPSEEYVRGFQGKTVVPAKQINSNVLQLKNEPGRAYLSWRVTRSGVNRLLTRSAWWYFEYIEVRSSR